MQKLKKLEWSQILIYPLTDSIYYSAAFPDDKKGIKYNTAFK